MSEHVVTRLAPGEAALIERSAVSLSEHVVTRLAPGEAALTERSVVSP